MSWRQAEDREESLGAQPAFPFFILVGQKNTRCRLGPFLDCKFSWRAGPLHAGGIYHPLHPPQCFELRPALSRPAKEFSMDLGLDGQVHFGFL